MASRSRGATVGGRIARERDRQGMSLSAFSRAVERETGEGVRGTSRTALRNLEEGRVDSPAKDVVEAIAKVLGVEEAWIWTGEAPRFKRAGGAAGVVPPAPARRPWVAAPAPSSGSVPPEPKRDWMESPPSLLRSHELAARGHTIGVATHDSPVADPDPSPAVSPGEDAGPVDVPWVPEAHPVWGPGVARTIAARSLLARGPRTVRARLWSVLRTAADHPGSGVTGPDDMLRLARQLDDLVLRPLELLRPGEAPEGPRFESYALSLLESVESLLESAAEGPLLTPLPDRPAQQPAMPPSFQQPGRAERRERDGLTWRLM